jgi:anti-sigma-K factor RskA
MTHLSSEQLLDLAEGTRDRADFPHLARCGACERELADLRRVLTVAADVEVAEPSPLFWDHLAARVRDAVGDEPPAPPHRWWVPSTPWRYAVAAVAGLAVIVVAAAIVRRDAPAGQPSSAITVVDAAPAEGLAGFDDDPALTLLADLTTGMDWDAASEAGLTPAQGTVDKAVFTLTPEERVELHRILEEALAASGA